MLTVPLSEVFLKLEKNKMSIYSLKSYISSILWNTVQHFKKNPQDSLLSYRKNVQHSDLTVDISVCADMYADVQLRGHAPADLLLLG